MKKVPVFIFVLALNCAKSQAYVPGKTNPPPAIKEQDSATTVMVQAQFPGGPKAWQQYLFKNLRAEVATDIVLRRRQKDSLETVIVSFLVDTSGAISDVKVENQKPVTPTVAAEAKRVIENGPYWTPATINGRPVIYRQKQSISFSISSR